MSADRPTDGPVGFRVDVVRQRDLIVVAPIGELDIATVDELDDRLSALHAGGCREFILDLSQLTFIDSTGLRLVVNWNRQAAAGQLDFSIIDGPPNVQRTFELSGVGALLRRSSVTDGAGPA
jgi:anti-sigma B factor antagonist